MVTFTTVGLLAYGIIALLFLENTFQEGHVRTRTWDVGRVLGLLLCLVWPLTLVGVVLVAFWQRQRLRISR
ncbi:hypothetical protein [Rhizobium sp. SG2393]|uniref:hypothetical protein n=1 Tax=Rhizobium sp. SG2393 TaxID=3276279 RepID=UPI00366B0431